MQVVVHYLTDTAYMFLSLSLDTLQSSRSHGVLIMPSKYPDSP